jgi:hypothetical protein
MPSTRVGSTTNAPSSVFESRSPDGRWVVSLRWEDCRYLTFTPTSGGRPERFATPEECGWDGGGTGGEWVAPHLFLIGDNFIVARIDPATRVAKMVAALHDISVSGNGEWIVGDGPGDPANDAQANTTYVVSLRGHPTCLVVPGLSHATGFTAGGEVRVVTQRGIHGPSGPVKQFAISSLRPTCPTGFNGILNASSQWAVDVTSPGW